MPESQELILGEFHRTLDDRYRLSVPGELADRLIAEGSTCILAKERPGCLGLWSASVWQAKLDDGVALIKQKVRMGNIHDRISQFQLIGRLLSTRHKLVQLTGRGRLLIPEGFREFLGVESGGEVMVVGAGLCVEIWNPPAWFEYIAQEMPEFRTLFEELSR